jgi:hypothetical protein
VIIYIKTADSSGHCNMYTFGFLTTRGDFWLAAKLVACPERLYSMEVVS